MARDARALRASVDGPVGVAVGELLGPVRLDDQHGEFGQPGGEAGEPGEGFAVGPVRVVHYEEQRPMAEAGGEPGHEVVEAVPDTLGIELRPDGVGQAEGGCGDLEPVAEEGTGLVGGEPVQRGLEQLAYDVEGHRGDRLAATRGPYRAAVGGHGPDLSEQRGLPDRRPRR